MTIEIVNVDESVFISDLLSEVQKIGGRSSVSTEIDSKTIEGAKGEILTSILLGITSNAAFEFIKTALLIHQSRPDYKPDLKLHIEGKKLTLDYIRNTDSRELSIKINK